MTVRFFEGTSFSYCCPSCKNVFGIDKTCVRDDIFPLRACFFSFYKYPQSRSKQNACYAETQKNGISTCKFSELMSTHFLKVNGDRL